MANSTAALAESGLDRSPVLYTTRSGATPQSSLSGASDRAARTTLWFAGDEMRILEIACPTPEPHQQSSSFRIAGVELSSRRSCKTFSLFHRLTSRRARDKYDFSHLTCLSACLSVCLPVYKPTQTSNQPTKNPAHRVNSTPSTTNPAVAVAVAVKLSPASPNNSSRTPTLLLFFSFFFSPLSAPPNPSKQILGISARKGKTGSSRTKVSAVSHRARARFQQPRTRTLARTVVYSNAEPWEMVEVLYCIYVSGIYFVPVPDATPLLTCSKYTLESLPRQPQFAATGTATGFCRWTVNTADSSGDR